MLLCQTFGMFFTVHCSSSLSCIHGYLTIDSGGYLYTNSTNCSVVGCFLEKSRWYSIEQIFQGVPIINGAILVS